MHNYTRVPCHVATNLVAKGGADSDLSVRAIIMPMLKCELRTVEAKACTLVCSKLTRFVP